MAASFFQPRYGRTCDKILSITADGACSMQKGLKYLQVGFGNVSYIARDPCHTIRIACGKPAKLEEEFAEWWYDIFLRKKTALIPQLQYSQKLRYELMACQHLGCMGSFFGIL